MSNLFEIENLGQILITGHVNPDGDALGSALAFKLILKQKNIEADVCFDISNSLPTNLDHLPLELVNKEAKNQYDTVYVFDCGSSERLGKYESLALNAENIIVVDHHINPTFGTLQIIDPTAASTTQVLFRELESDNILITKEVANCLMTGLITDTGRFQYSNTNSEVFDIASKLMKYGSDLTMISENIYGSVPLNAMILQSKVLERMELFTKEKLIVSFILQTDYKKYKIESSEVDFLIDSIRLVKESEIALLLKEQTDGTFKGSLRSRTQVNVQEIASEFGGGGHKAASGFSSSLEKDQIVDIVRNAISKQL